MKADEFLKISEQFRLGNLVTESSHPVTAHLSDIAAKSTELGLSTLFDVDKDVVAKFDELVSSDMFSQAAADVRRVWDGGGRVVFTGCGATGRLSILLDGMLRKYAAARPELDIKSESLMAGGDFALIKSVEGFEDITAFGGKQVEELGLTDRDILFAITEGGETSWVIGTAWKALEMGARVYFVYNNPDDILRQRVIRSREVIDDDRITKINLTTGPMAITGSTRMQATTIELCYMAAVLETAITGDGSVPHRVAVSLREMLDTLHSPDVLVPLARLAEAEVKVFKAGRLNNYFASDLSIDILTDTTERSPTFCIPAFRPASDTSADESWSYLYVDADTAEEAWRKVLGRDIRAVEWDLDTIAAITDEKSAPAHHEVIKKISKEKILDFKIGRDGLYLRPPSRCGGASAVTDNVSELAAGTFFAEELAKAAAAGAHTGIIYIGNDEVVSPVENSIVVKAALPEEPFELDIIKRAGIKMLLNAFSTCVMTLMGAVMGNFMVHVVPSNLKLIDRCARYVQHLTGLDYETAVRKLFDVIAEIEDDMAAGRKYPPVVETCVNRCKKD